MRRSWWMLAENVVQSLPKSLSARPVDSVPIHQREGPYSPNDLHKGAGGGERNTPNRFIRADQTNGLIDDINQTPRLAFAFKTIRGTHNHRMLRSTTIRETEAGA